MNLRNPKVWVPAVVIAGFALLSVVVIATASDVDTAPPPPVMTAVRVVSADPVDEPETKTDPTSESSSVVEHLDIEPVGGPLTEQLTVQAGKAIRAGKRPFVEMRAGWCPICKRVDKHLLGTELGAELSDVVVIRVDTDVFGPELKEAGLTSKTIPAFYELDRRGKPTEHWVNGHRWGPKANVPAKLRAFFAAP